MKTTFLFPGQGSSVFCMLSMQNTDDPIVKNVFAEVEQKFGESPILFDTKERLASTVFVQLSLLICGVISARQALSKSIVPDFVAGHSIGAFAAAVISEVLTFEEALGLVELRSTMMENAYPKGYGMAAIVGFSETRLKTLLKEHNAKHAELFLANSNAADQQVVAGSLDSIGYLITFLQDKGARKAQLLSVSVPSHCRLLTEVSEALKEKLSEIPIRDPKIPYISNHSARILRTAEQVQEDLYKSVSQTVRWYEGTTLLYELGTRVFIEMAPSGVLSKIASSTFPEAHILSFGNQDLETLRWLYKSYNSDNY